jgi:AraC-like DNA-binding protein
MEGLTLEILAELVRVSKRVKMKTAPHWLRRVVDLIRTEYARSFTLSELAQVANVHPAYLAQVFRAHYHCTLGEFVRQLRIECAIQQMAEPNASLADIALATGFSDQSHFSRVFKRMTGLTPAQFRQLQPDPHCVQNT